MHFSLPEVQSKKYSFSLYVPAELFLILGGRCVGQEPCEVEIMHQNFPQLFFAYLVKCRLQHFIPLV